MIKWCFFSSEWKTAIRDKNCPCKTNAVARAKHLIERLRVCLNEFAAFVRDCFILIINQIKIFRSMYVGFLATLASRPSNTVVNIQR